MIDTAAGFKASTMFCMWSPCFCEFELAFPSLSVPFLFSPHVIARSLIIAPVSSVFAHFALSSLLACSFAHLCLRFLRCLQFCSSLMPGFVSQTECSSRLKTGVQVSFFPPSLLVLSHFLLPLSLLFFPVVLHIIDSRICVAASRLKTCRIQVSFFSPLPAISPSPSPPSLPALSTSLSLTGVQLSFFLSSQLFLVYRMCTVDVCGCTTKKATA